jgi:DNA-binding NtrC family response regulator
MAYDWPGNVRELQNAVESAMNQTDSTILTIKDFSQLTERIRMRERKQAVTHYKLIPAKQAFEKSLIQDALMTCEGNRKRAAELLGISRTMLYNKMAQYEIGDS